MAAAMDLENNWLNGSFGVKSRFIVVQELISVVAWWLDEGGWVGGDGNTSLLFKGEPVCWAKHVSPLGQHLACALIGEISSRHLALSQ